MRMIPVSHHSLTLRKRWRQQANIVTSHPSVRWWHRLLAIRPRRAKGILWTPTEQFRIASGPGTITPDGLYTSPPVEEVTEDSTVVIELVDVLEDHVLDTSVVILPAPPKD